LTLDKDEAELVLVEFLVASDAIVGDVSTIVVTATSQLDGTQNSVVAELVVISGVRYYHK
jgi:hypothetical protein